MALPKERQELIDRIQKGLNENKFAPEMLSQEQFNAVENLINEGYIKSEPLNKVLDKRLKAREQLATQQAASKDPIAYALGIDESNIPGGDTLFTGRSSAVAAGDIGASLYYILSNKDKVAEQILARGTVKTKSIPLFKTLANALPARFKFLKGTLNGFVGRTLVGAADLPVRAVTKAARSPLARFELGTAAVGTLGAGGGSLAYDLANMGIGEQIFYSTMADLGEMEYKPPEKLSVLENALVNMKNAALWNFGATALTPLLMVGGKSLNKLFGTTGERQKELAQFAMEKGLDAPFLAFLEGGLGSGMAKNYFKTIGVFPGIARVADKGFLNAEEKAARYFLNNVETIAPIYHQSALAMDSYNQAMKVYAENVRAYDALYKRFYASAEAAGNPRIVDLAATSERAGQFLERFRAEFPDLNTAMRGLPEGRSLDNTAQKVLEKLSMEADPFVSFYKYLNFLQGRKATMTEYKGLTQMLNNVLEQTKYGNIHQEVATIRAALEKDAHSFARNLNGNALLEDDAFKTLVDGAGGAQSDAGKKIIQSAIDSGNELYKKLRDANEAYSRMQRFYTSDASYLTKTVQKYNTNALTGKAMLGMTGMSRLPKQNLFNDIQQIVFESRSPEALINFKKMIGAQKGFTGYSAKGEELYKASVARFLHDAFMGSFTSRPLQQSFRGGMLSNLDNGAFRSIENDPRFLFKAKSFTEMLQDTTTLDKLYANGGAATKYTSPNGLVNINDIRFGKDDFRDFDARKFIDALGLRDPYFSKEAENMLIEMYKGLPLPKGVSPLKAVEDLRNFARHVDVLSQVPITNSSSFIQRRLQLGGFGSLAGVAMGMGGAGAINPFAPLVMLAMGIRAGQVLMDPTLLRIVNDVISPKELEALMKGGTIGGKQIKGRLQQNPYTLGLFTQKREAFARLMNKLFADDQDFPVVDPKSINLEEITDYLNKQPVRMLSPNFGDDGANIPEGTITSMYNEELMSDPTPEEKVVESNVLTGMAQGAATARNTFDYSQNVEQARPMSPMGMQQPMTPANGQISPQQVQALFPNDPTSALIAARRQGQQNVQ